jgi:hypothetical protein
LMAGLDQPLLPISQRIGDIVKAKSIRLVLLIIFGIFAANCTTERKSIQPSATTVQSPTNTHYPIPKEQTTVPLIAPTVRIILRVTQTPTVGITPKPTLTNEQIDSMQNQLQNNEICKLPCWWGIEPGKTTWKDAQDFLLSLGLYPSDGMYPAVDFSWFYQDGHIENSLYFLENGGLVETIDIKSLLVRTKSERFFSFWKNYSPENILKRYGKPSRIWIKSTSYGTVGVGYELWLFYDQQGFLIIIGGNTHLKEIYTICPSFKINNIEESPDDIEIVLSAPTDSRQLETLTDLYSIGSYPYILPLEKAANLSIDDFYKSYLEKGSSFCFDTPMKIWPP